MMNSGMNTGMNPGKNLGMNPIRPPEAEVQEKVLSELGLFADISISGEVDKFPSLANADEKVSMKTIEGKPLIREEIEKIYRPEP